MTRRRCARDRYPPHAQAMAFVTRLPFHLFNTVTRQSGERSASAQRLTNHWISVAAGALLPVALLVGYVRCLHLAAGTVAPSGGDWLHCLAVASSGLCRREVYELVARALQRA